MPKGQSHLNNKPRELQLKLYHAAKYCRNRRFHALYDRVCRPDILQRAFEEVKANRGAPGIDGQSISDVETVGVSNTLKNLRDELLSLKYRPKPVRRVYIAKADGSKRPLGIPTVRDRILQQACRIILEPIFEANFLNCSFGFRPKRGATDAVKEVKEKLARHSFVVDADIRKFFDNLDHELLLKLCAKRISDKRILKLLRQWLKAGVREKGKLKRSTKGTPQGGVISPLLANIYLHVFDMIWKRDYAHMGILIRYADDFVIVCKTRKDAENARLAACEILGKLKLELHPDKTRVVSMFDDSGFDFLGFRFTKITNRHTGKFSPMIKPSSKSVQRCREKISEHLSLKYQMLSLQEVVKRLNTFIRGWATYFARGCASRALQDLDRYRDWRLMRYFYRKVGPMKRKVAEYFGQWRRYCGVINFYNKGICGQPL